MSLMRFGAREETESQRLGWKIRNARVAVKMSLREAAMRLGLTAVELANIERGVTTPSDWQLKDICALFPEMEALK